jgi:hypothetical protein
VEIGRPNAKPRGTDPCSLLLGKNTTVFWATPASQELRELRVLSELGQRRPRPSGVPEERLEQHLFQEGPI